MMIDGISGGGQLAATSLLQRRNICPPANSPAAGALALMSNKAKSSEKSKAMGQKLPRTISSRALAYSCDPMFRCQISGTR